MHKPRPVVMRLGCVSAALIMVVGGALTFHWLVIAPALRVLEARDWQAVECHIHRNAVVRFDQPNTIEDGVTYFIDIEYSYTMNGRQYRSKRFDLLHDTSSGGSSSKQRWVDRYPAGSKRICYVDPGNPTQAVINRGLPPRMIWGLLPLACLLCGILGLPFAFIVE